MSGRRESRRSPALASCLLLLVAVAALSYTYASPKFPRALTRVTLTLLATTDLHGHLFPLDEETGRPANLGLAKIATLIARERAAHPNTLLLDCGDTTQGTAFAYLAARSFPEQPNPIIAAMNVLGYDAMAVGNHDFNFGLPHLAKIRGEARFPILGANVESLPGAPGKAFPASIVRTVAGVRVGIIGVVTPGIARGEIPDNYRGYRFRPILESTEQVAAQLRPTVDVLVLIAHSGLGRDPSSPGPASDDGRIPENAMIEVAQKVAGLDVILSGHTHQEVAEKIINGVLLSQAKFWGQSLAEAAIELESAGGDSWMVTSKHSKVIPVTGDDAPDSSILAPAQSIEEATERFLDRPVARIARPLEGAAARVENHSLVEWIHRAQLEAGRADVSLATMFRTGVRFQAGMLTVRNFFALYPYDNVLYTIEMTGAELKGALEHAASFYPSWPPAVGPTASDLPIALPTYEADSAAGVSYIIDLRQPVGSRVRELTFRGRPLDPGQRLLVALNHYRYYGDERFRSRKIIRQAPEHVFESLLVYAERVKELPVEAPGTWRIEPPEAREALLRAAAKH